MATIYELSDLKKIHKAKEALKGVVYQTEKKYFIATPEGRLVETTDAVIINNHIASATADIEDLLESIEDLENTGNDYHSGYSKINSGDTVTIEENKQMTNWNKLEIDGTLIIEGELILK